MRAFLAVLLALPALAGAAVNVTLAQGGRPLPFPVEPHPLQLSATLFGGASAGGGALPAVAGLADEPFPTGAWWTNLVLERGEAAVVTMPYVVRMLGEKAHVSFPFRVVTPTVVQSGFIAQVVLSSASGSASNPIQPPTAHQVVGFDSFGVNVRFLRQDTPEFTLLLMRGSPYVTMEFSGSRPVIESTDGLTLSRLKRLDGLVFMDGSDVEFAVYSLLVSNGQMWYAFASDPALALEMDANGRVVAKEAFTGVLRVALSLDATTFPYLLESASVYPTGGAVNYTADPIASDVAKLEFRWKTKSFAAFAPDTDSSSRRSAELLMLALPHHMDIMQVQSASSGGKKTTAAEANKVVNILRYSSIRGLMEGVLGSVWFMRETLPPVAWNFADDGLFSDEYDAELLKGVPEEEEKALRLAMRQTAEDLIVENLKQDINKYPMLAGDDSYNFGKQIGRETRLLLMADRFGQHDIVAVELKKIEDALEPWLDGSNPDKLVYDETFGGVVTSFGLRSKDADYGNGYYNDHHFHYGYFIYALAVVRKFDPDFVHKYALACAMLLADIGTPPHSAVPFFDDLPANRFFPVARHKDWFVGHSYASGLFQMEDGKSQESSSECTNAYYAMTLFSSLDADAQVATSYHQYTRVMLATELRSAKKYWHMRTHSKIYEPIFSKNAMVGVVGEMSVVYSTWFGDRPVYVHGINMLPFTPITPYLIGEAFVVTEYPMIAGDIGSLDPHDIWRSIVVMDHAILDAATAWDELVDTVKAFDTWNSPSNSLYWVATRPSWFSQRNRKVLTEPKSSENDLCFGYPACSAAGDNGTALLCCSTLPGCCPSLLGCCPKEETANLPPNACFGEYECGVLGLGCCNSIDGCCQPDPLTGAVLGCCKNQHPATPMPLATRKSKSPSAGSGANGTAELCYNEPQCAVAGLDCCAAPGGCCSGPGPKLSCCSLAAPQAVAASADDGDECHGQPTCAAAGLDCCATAAGCCLPDPTSGATLDCCAAPPPVEDPTCHGEPACAAAGVDCCATAAGCCEPDAETDAVLDCCQAAQGERGGGGSASVATGSGNEKTGASSRTVSWLFVGVGGLGIAGLAAFMAVTCFRRRGYDSVDRDMRALYCAGMMIAVVAFFVFLIIMS